MRLDSHFTFFLISFVLFIIALLCYYLYYLYDNIGAIVFSLFCLILSIFLPNDNIIIENSILMIKSKIFFNLITIRKRNISTSEINYITYKTIGGDSLLLHRMFIVDIVGKVKHIKAKGFYYEVDLKKLVEKLGRLPKGPSLPPTCP